jgi:hypothetical protein
LSIQLLVLPLFSTSSQVLYFEDDCVMEVELAIHIYVDKWPMTTKQPRWTKHKCGRWAMIVGGDHQTWFWWSIDELMDVFVVCVHTPHNNLRRSSLFQQLLTK